jgi:hypothetical protein
VFDGLLHAATAEAGLPWTLKLLTVHRHNLDDSLIVDSDA